MSSFLTTNIQRSISNNYIRSEIIKNWSESTYTSYINGNHAEIVLFGSWGSKYASNNSDLDLLIVSPSSIELKPPIDLKIIAPSDLYSKRWLGSELANHIARYGKWIVGSGNWRRDVYISNFCLSKKGQQILKRLNHIYLNKDKLSQYQIIKHLDRAITDSCRLGFMIKGYPVPPTNYIKSLNSADIVDLLKSGLSHKNLRDLFEYYIRSFFSQTIDLEFLAIKIKNSWNSC